MLTYILIGLAVVIVIFVIVVAAQPADFRIARSAKISAPPALVFAEVYDFHKWEAWSPWAKMDANSKSTFDGPPAGTGTIMSWVGNNKVGEGRMTILESRPSELIRIKLEFFKPFKAVNTAEFTFTAEGSQTNVTWSMTGKNNFIGKAIGTLMNCDKMIGGQFAEGLAGIKAIAEKNAAK